MKSSLKLKRSSLYLTTLYIQWNEKSITLCNCSRKLQQFISDSTLYNHSCCLSTKKCCSSSYANGGVSKCLLIDGGIRYVVTPKKVTVGIDGLSQFCGWWSTWNQLARIIRPFVSSILVLLSYVHFVRNRVGGMSILSHLECILSLIYIFLEDYSDLLNHQMGIIQSRLWIT